MDEQNFKEVNFNKYCPICKYRDNSEDSDECNECLNEPARIETSKPLRFKEDKHAKKKA